MLDGKNKFDKLISRLGILGFAACIVSLYRIIIYYLLGISHWQKAQEYWERRFHVYVSVLVCSLLVMLASFTAYKIRKKHEDRKELNVSNHVTFCRDGWPEDRAIRNQRGTLMNEENKNLLKAPWSNQRVGLFFRLLAWVYILCGVFGISAAIFFSVKEGLPKEHALFFIVMFAGLTYSLLLFGYVAIKGRAPAGWLPW